jgi:ribosomal protein S18 acetylase RimI-like enzyme
MNNIMYKKLESSDVTGVWNLIQQLKSEGSEVSFTDLTKEEEVLQWVDSYTNLVYLAIENDQVIAMVKARRDENPSKSHSAFLSAATTAEARGNGIAAKLTNHCLEDLKNQGFLIARIYVYSDNKASLAAVRKLGFNHSGTVLMHHRDEQSGEYIDDIIFHKIL